MDVVSTAVLCLCVLLARSLMFPHLSSPTQGPTKGRVGQGWASLHPSLPPGPWDPKSLDTTEPDLAHLWGPQETVLLPTHGLGGMTSRIGGSQGSVLRRIHQCSEIGGAREQSCLSRSKTTWGMQDSCEIWVPQPCDKPFISTHSHLSIGRAGSRVIHRCQGQILESTWKNSSLIFCHTSWRHAMDSSDSLILKLRYSLFF